MRIHMIDATGNVPNNMPLIRANIRIGDTVACFDTKVFGVQTMESQQDIDNYQPAMGGGTLFAPIVEFAKEKATYFGETLILIYSDMLFADSVESGIQSCFDGIVRFLFVGTDEADPDTMKRLERGFRYSSRSIDAAPTLFLAEIEQSTSEYMGKTTTARMTRIVRARSAAEAEHLVVNEFSNDDQYGSLRRVDHVEIYPVIE